MVLLPGVRSRSLLSVDYLARFGLLGDVRPAIGSARLGSAFSRSAGRPGSAAVKQEKRHCLDKNILHVFAPLSDCRVCGLEHKSSPRVSTRRFAG